MRIDDLTLYHFPGCPFSERVEIVLRLKGAPAIRDIIIDISEPRPAWLLEKTGNVTALPALETPWGVLMESGAIVRFLDDSLPGRHIASDDPFVHAREEMLAGLSTVLSSAGYRMIQNRDRAARSTFAEDVDAAWRRIDAFLTRHATGDIFLLEDFGWSEMMLTPVMKRLWFLDYYEDHGPPSDLRRLALWRDACLSHPATQDRGFEEIIKLYHDYSRGFGGGKMPPGRRRSSFAPDPHWSKRPMPLRDKWAPDPTDEDLGLDRLGCRNVQHHNV